LGILLPARYAGVCPECEEDFDVGEEIYYEKRPKPKKSIVCVNYKCFTDQGGKLDTPPETNKGEEYFFIPPTSAEENTNEWRIIESILNTMIVSANKKVKELMPNLNPNSNTFGQVRNAFITHYKDIFLARNFGTKKT